MNTAQAAAACGMTTGVFRAHMTRLRKNGGPDLRLPQEQWTDLRTPTYDDQAVKAWAEGRRGRDPLLMTIERDDQAQDAQRPRRAGWKP